MRRAVVMCALLMSGIILSVVFGLTLLMRKISLRQMNNMNALH